MQAGRSHKIKTLSVESGIINEEGIKNLLTWPEKIWTNRRKIIRKTWLKIARRKSQKNVSSWQLLSSDSFCGKAAEQVLSLRKVIRRFSEENEHYDWDNWFVFAPA